MALVVFSGFRGAILCTESKRQMSREKIRFDETKLVCSWYIIRKVAWSRLYSSLHLGATRTNLSEFSLLK